MVHLVMPSCEQQSWNATKVPLLTTRKRWFELQDLADYTSARAKPAGFTNHFFRVTSPQIHPCFWQQSAGHTLSAMSGQSCLQSVPVGKAPGNVQSDCMQSPVQTVLASPQLWSCHGGGLCQKEVSLSNTWRQIQYVLLTWELILQAAPTGLLSYNPIHIKVMLSLNLRPHWRAGHL